MVFITNKNKMNRIATFEMFDKITKEYIGIEECFQIRDDIRNDQSIKGMEYGLGASFYNLIFQYTITIRHMDDYSIEKLMFEKPFSRYSVNLIKYEMLPINKSVNQNIKLKRR